MRRKIHVKQTNVVFHYSPGLGGGFNRTRHTVSDVLKVRVTNYSRQSLWVSVDEVKRLSITEIKDRIETFLDTSVTTLGYCYDVELPTLYMPLTKDPTPIYPVLGKLRTALGINHNQMQDRPPEHRTAGIQVHNVGHQRSSFKTKLTLSDIDTPSSRELEQIIRSVI